MKKRKIRILEHCLYICNTITFVSLYLESLFLVCCVYVCNRWPYLLQRLERQFGLCGRVLRSYLSGRTFRVRRWHCLSRARFRKAQDLVRWSSFWTWQILRTGLPRTVLVFALSLALGSLTAAWIRYCTTNFTGSTSQTGCSSSWQCYFIGVWTVAHHRTCRTTATWSPVLSLGGVGVDQPTVSYLGLSTYGRPAFSTAGPTFHIWAL